MLHSTGRMCLFFGLYPLLLLLLLFTGRLPWRLRSATAGTDDVENFDAMPMPNTRFAACDSSQFDSSSAYYCLNTGCQGLPSFLILNYDPRKVLWCSWASTCYSTREKGETSIRPAEMDWSEVDGCDYLGYHGIYGICVYWTSLCANDYDEERCRCR